MGWVNRGKGTGRWASRVRVCMCVYACIASHLLPVGLHGLGGVLELLGGRLLLGQLRLRLLDRLERLAHLSLNHDSRPCTKDQHQSKHEGPTPTHAGRQAASAPPSRRAARPPRAAPSPARPAPPPGPPPSPPPRPYGDTCVCVWGGGGG